MDFPVGIVVRDPDIAAHAAADGGDLVVTAGDGLSVLDVERPRYVAGELEIWARVPELAPSTTALYLYYGGPPVAESASTWAARFAGVWHLSQPGDAAPDSTGRASALVPTSPGATPAHVEGAVGTARELDGDDSLDGGDPANDAIDFGTASFSYTAWVFQMTPSGTFDMPFYKGGTTDSQPGYCLLLGSGPWEAKLHDGTTYEDPSFGDEQDLRGRWVHLAAVVDRAAGSFTVYTDGVMADQRSIAGLGSLSTASSIAVGRGTQSAYRGRVDELRIYRVPLEPAWIAAEHANHTAPTFLRIGPEEARP
jgi:hypothetical protein